MKLMPGQTTQVCRDCQRDLPIAAYSREHGPGTIRLMCRHCYSILRRPQQRIMRLMYLSAKKTAKRKGLDFDITYEYLQQLKESQNNECPYSGMQLNWDIAPIQREYRVPPDRASIERRDSKKGYTKDNVELVAHCVNLMKNEYAHPFLYLTCHQIVENMNRRQVIEYFLYN